MTLALFAAGGHGFSRAVLRASFTAASAAEVETLGKPPRDRSLSDSSTYFITARTWQGRTLFQSERMARLFIETLYAYRAQARFHLHEFVVMPNHFHLILSPGAGITLERAMQLIKGGFSHEAGNQIGRTEIWQRGYVDHRIRDATDYQKHRDYLLLNPVRARLASSIEEYCYSSAHPGFELDPIPQGLKPSS